MSVAAAAAAAAELLLLLLLLLVLIPKLFSFVYAQGQLADACDPLLMPLIHRYFELMPSISGVEQGATGVTHASAERLQLQKAYFSFLHHIINHGVTRILVSAGEFSCSLLPLEACYG